MLREILRFEVVAVSLVASLAGCGGSPQSTAPQPAAAAPAQVSQLASAPEPIPTAPEIRAEIAQIASLLKPVKQELRKFGEQLDLRLAQRPGHHIRRLINKLDRVLRQSQAGSPAILPDGSWDLDVFVSPLGPYFAPACDLLPGLPGSIRGRRTPNHDELGVYLGGCGDPVQRQFAAATFQGEQTDVRFSTLFFEGAPVPGSVREDHCTLRSVPGRLDFRCQPFTLRGRDAILVVDTLDIEQTITGVAASIHVTVSDPATGVVYGDVGFRE